MAVNTPSGIVLTIDGTVLCGSRNRFLVTIFLGWQSLYWSPIRHVIDKILSINSRLAGWFMRVTKLVLYGLPRCPVFWLSGLKRFSCFGFSRAMLAGQSGRIYIEYCNAFTDTGLELSLFGLPTSSDLSNTLTVHLIRCLVF